MALGKMALGKMAGWVKWRRVKWHWVKWNWVDCHVTLQIISKANFWDGFLSVMESKLHPAFYKIWTQKIATFQRNGDISYWL